MTNRIVYYLVRIKELGLKRTTERLHHRICENITHYRFKSRIVRGTNTMCWEQFQTLFSQPVSVASFIEKHSPVAPILAHQRFSHFFDLEHNEKVILAHAEKTAHSSVAFFGKTATFANHQSLPWHDDFFTPIHQRPWYKHKKIPFYRDLSVIACKKGEGADIKVPWELSRMHHLVWAAYGASITGEEKYLTACTEQVESWIHSNPYLVGVNWKCPMDVALRALNLLWIFYYLSSTKEVRAKIPEAFFKKLIISLYHHFEFVLHNWELSDKPNNHYLADIVGSLYLAHFFKESALARKEHAHLEKRFFDQLDSQVFAEGTDYEGSTSYHGLVTALSAHGLFLVEQAPENYWKKLEKMRQFYAATHKLQVGDNDSGIVVPHLALNTLSSPKNIVTFKEFGLTVVSTRNLTLSFRHPVCQKRQPTGHFHADHLSITLSLDGCPLFVDPGTACYTGNARLRNELRSAASHTTFYLPNQATQSGVILDNLSNLDLFQMPQVPRSFSGSTVENEHHISLHDSVNLYPSLKLERRVTINTDYQNITLCDALIGSASPIEAVWHFILHPDVVVKQIEPYRFTLTVKKITATLTTPVPASIVSAVYSPAYGEAKETVKIRFTASLKTASHALSLITWSL